ncbi:MAG: hypothetical protein Q9175_007071 [Cornicularia normoerica]
MDRLPHHHSTAKGEIAPSVDQYRKAGEAIRERWTEEQRRRIAENDAVLRQLAETDPKVGNLSIKTNLPRGNDLTVQEQIAIIHSDTTPAQDTATRGMVLERQRQDIIDNTSLISQIFPARVGVPQTKDTSQIKAEQTHSLEWDDFPELDAEYGPPPQAETSKNLNPTSKRPPKSNTKASCDSSKGKGLAFGLTQESFLRYQDGYFLNTNRPCTGPCPVKIPHNQGAYLQQGQVPRAWNARWGYSDPPRKIWDAWVRIEQGRGSSSDEGEVDGFALSHWWAGP